MQSLRVPTKPRRSQELTICIETNGTLSRSTLLQIKPPVPADKPSLTQWQLAKVQV